MIDTMLLMRTVLLIFLATAVSATTGCKFLEKAKEEAEKKEKEEKKDDEDTELAEKLNRYIPCFNKASKTVLASRGRYFAWVDPAKGPQGKERIVFGLYKLNATGIEACKKGIKEGKDLKPELDKLEKAAKTYKKALSTVVPLVDKAHKYYDRDDYKDDRMAKGKAMHKPLVDAFAAFSDADNKLREVFAKHKKGMAERELKRIAKHEGKNLHWHSRKLILEAKTLIEVADVPEKELDQKKLKRALNSFGEAHEALDDYASEHEAEADKVLLFGMFLSASEAYLKAAKNYQRRVRDKQPFSRGEQSLINSGNAKMVPGHPSQMVDKYNGMIDRSNALRWP